MKLKVPRRALVFMVLSAAACWAGQELPTAPSAVVEQRNAPPPPAAKPQPPKPAPATAAPKSSPAAASATSSSATPASTAQPAAAAPGSVAKPSPSSAMAEDPGKVGTITRAVDEVSVIFTVTDKHKRFVKDLSKNDFVVLDDKKPVQLRSFNAETDLPLRVGLLVDASNSIRDRFRFEQESAIEFLSQIVRPKRDHAFVLGFDTTAEVTQDFTDDTEKLSNGVRMLRPGGGTALFDALYFACRDKLLKSNDRETVRRAIILVSDGEDNQSRVSREEAIEMAQRADVIVYTIGTNISGTVEHGDKVLKRIAEATGGRVFFPFKIQDVANAFSEIEDELRSQYAVSYKPTDFARNGRFRSIDILTPNKKFIVRARKGYYAPTR